MSLENRSYDPSFDGIRKSNGFIKNFFIFTRIRLLKMFLTYKCLLFFHLLIVNMLSKRFILLGSEFEGGFRSLNFGTLS